MPSLAWIVLAALISMGCQMPEYQTFIDQQKQWATMGSSSRYRRGR